MDCRFRLRIGAAPRRDARPHARWADEHHEPQGKRRRRSKAYGRPTFERVIRRCMQLLGPEGTRKDLPLEKWYRDAEILDVFEGRRKVQRISIGRTLNGSRLGEDMTMVSENARHRAWKGIDPGRATGVTGTTESRYVIDDRDTPRFRVHRSTMVDDAILEEERRRIFDRSWLFVGHETEIENPHDFRTRNVGGRPIIFQRTTAGEVKVFVNSCPHRGMQIETRGEGHGRFLKCFYHGWSFDTSGELVALPGEESYGENFDRHNLCLVQPAKVESYRGFVFLSWTSDIADLVTYLAGATDIIDLFADQSELGMRVIGGSHLYAAKANWKLLSENSYDGYHAFTTHHRYLAMLKESGKDLSLVFKAGSAANLGYDLGNGHAVIGGADATGGRNTGLGRDLSGNALEKQMARRNHFAELYGADWANRMFSGRNIVIFPNLAMVDLIMGITLRTYYPVAPGYMEVTAWSLQPKDDDPDLRRMRQENFLTFWGPAGLATPDDIEALERCQRGFVAADIAPWNDISRGMASDRKIFTDELQMRTFWREWDRRMTGTEHPAEVVPIGRRGRVGLPGQVCETV